jgi:tRNA G18 (ribose-2'-O)-methylase SpoU
MNPEPITDLDDPRVADYRDVRDADLRGGGGRAPRGLRPDKLFMAESELVVRRLLASRRFEVKSLFLSPERLAALSPLIEANAPGAAVFVAAEALMRSIAGYRHHHGALAAGYRPPPGAEAADPAHLFAQVACKARFVMLIASGVTNVDNVGSILRSAAAFGAAGVVFDDACADPLFRLAIRVSMGHAFTVPWARAAEGATLPDLIDTARRTCAATVIALESGAGGHALPDLPHAARTALVVGSERHGLPREALDRCDVVGEIPMAGGAGVDSLNVAVAAAIGLYERSRGRRGQ